MRSPRFCYIMLHWKQGRRILIAVATIALCITIFWTVSFMNVDITTTIPGTPSSGHLGVVRVEEDWHNDSDLYDEGEFDTENDYNFVEATRAIRKKYRGFYMQTFYTLMKSEAEYHPNSRVLQEMLARAKDYVAKGSESKHLPNLTSLDDRMQFQKKALDEYCLSRNNAEPLSDIMEFELNKHLLYDDEKKIIFCYVPKVGCSNWKRMFVVLNGILPPTVSTERPPEDILRQAKKFAFLEPREQQWRLEKYFKFTMLRNPLERIVSAYRNKALIQAGTSYVNSFPSKESLFMLRKFEPDVFKSWKKEAKPEIRPSFDSFLRFLTLFPKLALNEHYRSFVDLCHPCHVGYDLYLNFKNLPSDVFEVMDKFHIPHHYYLNQVSHHRTPTSKLMDLYFGNLNKEQRQKTLSSIGKNPLRPPKEFSVETVPRKTVQNLLVSWKDELDFYYAMYPEEADSHLKYLQ